MGASFLTQWFSDHAIKAICWTLIHSLWIGMIIALLTGLVISFTRRSAAGLRYQLLCGILVLFVLSVSVTFFVEERSAGNIPVKVSASKFTAGPVSNIAIYYAGNPVRPNLINSAISFLDQHINIIFLVWVLFFVLKSLKMMSGLLYIQRIRNYKVHAVAEEFKHKMELFSRQIGIRQTVRLLQSELVSVPVAVGWLKPVILLPVGVILQLSTEQLESILWHELAHICRRDYLVNILQGIVETVFFFNPGLLWLSSLIRAEREACCDDMVLSRVGQKANYLEALLSFGQGEYKWAGLAMSMGSGNQLRDRLKRILSQENKRLSIVEKAVLGVGLILLTAFTTIPKAGQAASNLAGAVSKTISVMVKRHTDTVARIIKTPATGNLQPAEPEKPADEITNKIVDTAIRFRSVLFKHSDADLANNDISAVDDKGKKYHLIVANSKLVAMDIDGEKVKEGDIPNYQYMVTQIDAAVHEKRHIRETDMARFKASQPDVKFKADRRFYDKRRDVDSMTSAYTKVMNDIIAGLVVHNVVSKAADVKWFALTENEFIVNGQKQPDESQQRYKAKYGVHEGWGLYYGPVPMQGKGVFIDPEGMAKEQRLRDSIRYKPFNARFEPDDERRAFKLQMMRQRLNDDSVSYARQRQRALNVIAGLVADKVVPGAASVKWFGLSNTEFIVNGQKQPDEMQQRYKAKYGVYEGNGLYYGPVQMHGVGVFIDATEANEGMQHPPRQPKAPRAPNYKSSTKSRYTDSVAWKNRQLIKQQALFAADQDKKRNALVQQQQLFLADQNSKRAKLVQQQQVDKLQQMKTREDQSYDSKIVVPDIVAGITDDLVSSNVIRDKSELIKFNLTNSTLMVNGKKQPEEVHERLKAKFLQQPGYLRNTGITADPNFGVHFNAQNGNMGLGITAGPDSP